MNVQQFMNSDLRLIVSMLGDGWRWWIDELRDMLPERLVASGAPKVRGTIDTLLMLRPTGGGSLPKDAAAIALDEGIALIRRIDLPLLSRRDLTLLLDNESDRFFPFANGDAAIAHRIDVRRADPPGLTVLVGALPMPRANTIVERDRKSVV